MRNPENYNHLTAVIIDFPPRSVTRDNSFVVRPSNTPNGPVRYWPLNNVVHAFAPRTVILQRQWIDACLRARRCLCETDDWGGWRVR